MIFGCVAEMNLLFGNFGCRNIGSPKVNVESLILMIEHVLVSILSNLTRATLLSLRNHININMYIMRRVHAQSLI